MNWESFWKEAGKFGRKFWKGLNKVSAGAGVIIASVISGIFSLIKDYLAAERMPPNLTREQAITFSIIRRAKNKHRAILFWAFTVSGVGLASVSGIDKMSGSDRLLFEPLCAIMLLSIFPAIFFTFSTFKWRMTINDLNAQGGPNGQ